MLINERRQQILAILHRDQFVTVEKLCGALYASPATIRRDLAEMARQGVLRRLRGGAEQTEGSNSDIPLLLRFQKDKEKKERIAALAARFLGGATTIFMDSSSTAYYLARRLKDYTGRSVVTCGLATMNYLNEQTSASVYCTGGRILHQSSFVGGHAVETVRAHHADVLFFSCCGFSAAAGSTEAEEENAAVKRAMCENAEKRILLCDSGKFNHDYFCKVCPTSRIDLIVTDEKPDGETAATFGNRLIFAG